MFQCAACHFTCAKKGDWKRHISSRKHSNANNVLQNVLLENQKLRSLVLEQQVHLKSIPHAQKFNLTDFLNKQCSAAVDWDAFVSSIEVKSCCTVDITEEIAKLISDTANNLGLSKRPLHCLDSKRKKMCLKMKHGWVLDPVLIETKMQDTASFIQNKFIKKSQEWLAAHPFWHENESESHFYAQLLHHLSASIELNRFVSVLCSQLPLDKTKGET